MTDVRLNDRKALVTGGAQGLGEGMARALAAAGAQVVVADLQDDLGPKVAESLGAGHGFVHLDITDDAGWDAAVTQAVDLLGGLDIVVNNAGIIRRGPTVDTTDADWNAVIDVNLHSVFRMCRAAGRHMLATGRGGKIINIASLLSFQGGLNVPAYAASKSAVAGLTRELSNEWAGKGINVNAIAPGYMRTDNTVALQNDETRNRQIVERIPAGRWGEPSDLAGAAVFLASRASDYVNGHVLAVDGGWLGR
jgi:2-deoxy-D-gluconate 3-dehydrogenase